MNGWKDDDAVTITYRTLRQAQAESAAAEQERIIKLLEDDFWHDLVPTQQIVLASETYVSGRYHHAKNCHGCRFIALIEGKK